MRIAICEDMPEDTRQLREALTRYLEANRIDAEVDCFESGEQFLSAFEPGKYHIVFLDIMMREGGISGMDAAKKVSRADREAAVILVTSSQDYLHAGYDYSIYYIVKPVTDAKLHRAMEKCWAQVEQNAKTIEILVNRLPVKIRLRDIYCIESLGRTCVFTTEKSEYTATNLIIDGLVEKLGNLPFVRCHRSYIVNLLHVKRIEEKETKEFILENGQSIVISRTYQADCLKAFKEYFFSRIKWKPE